MFRKRHPQVGAAPGTLVIPEDAPPPRIRQILYSVDGMHVDRRIDDLDDLEEAPGSGVSWVDVQGFGDERLLVELAEIYGLHPLLLEDVVNVPQRSKVELHDDNLLIVLRMVKVGDDAEITIEQVGIVLGEDYVLTFQEKYGDVFDPIRKRITAGHRRFKEKQADYLAYAIADSIIDHYYPALEVLGERLEDLEEEAVATPTTTVLQKIHHMKNRLLNLRRALWPQREALHSMVWEPNTLVGEEVRLHLRDTYDHCVQTTEVIEMYRDMISGMLNTYLSSMANRTNEIMRVLTIVSTIFIPMSFLAGVYGMNFKDMPELKWPWGYPMFWMIVTFLAIGMLFFFGHKGWLHPQDHKQDEPE
ncbi:magnesium/cobalt transporter CorA [Blastopirellula sp. JC732]|uniref:Magnesium transport protein CorA n=1 Tax=Blastopirellula sediminis TaxID=2894196 RepID=A0A9X1MQD8_9BACT|nr:magnesium/cobalt transporter CorA [Blastopirellula sediminis]MCC9605837.1 magnesium/cobalt transporter CorA [Blastopirellula sediminis]MCC9630864.1 magnesium/cobalt transporter CorA [Blastopirellula sediminis]